MRTPAVLSMIFANMPDISKWRRRFLTVLFTTIFAIRGRVTFTNLARYSPLHEHTFRRHFRSFFDSRRLQPRYVLACARRQRRRS